MTIPTESAYVDGAALDSEDTLFGDAANQIELTLATDIGDGSTSFTVSEAITAVNVPCMFVFQTGEIVFVEGKNEGGKAFTTVQRGVGGTTPQSHTAGENVRLVIAAEHHNLMKSAMIAVQTVLGVEPQGTFDDVDDRLHSHNHDGTGDNGSTIATEDLTGHDKTAHDALDIDADTLDGYDSLDLLMPHVPGSQARTISSGEVAMSSVMGRLVLTSESGTSDTLDDITGGSEGDVVVIGPATDHTITIAHASGKILLPGDHDVVLSDPREYIGLFYNGTDWHMLFDSRNSKWAGIVFPIDQGGGVIAAGFSFKIPGLPFEFVVNEVRMVGAQSGSGVVEFYRDSWPDIPTHSVIGADTFTGGGLDDMTAGGYFSGNGVLNMRVEIEGTGTPNTFKWSIDGGSNWAATGVGMTGTAQSLGSYGITVTFAATTGHTIGNRWDFVATSDRIGYVSASSEQVKLDTALSTWVDTLLPRGCILEAYVASNMTSFTQLWVELMGYRLD